MPPTTTKAAPATSKVTKTILTKEELPPEDKPIAAPPVRTVAPSEDFWRYIQNLTEDDWKNRGHHVSLYRYPIGQSKPQHLGRYVKTYKLDTPLVSEDQIFEEFGGGQYDALLRGPARDGSERVTLIAKHSWEMDGPAKNPWASSGAPGAAVPGGPSDLNATLQVVLQHLQSLQKSSTGGDPAIKESISLIQQLTNAMPKPQGVTELVQALASLKELTGGDGNTMKDTLELLKSFGVIGGEKTADRPRSLATELKEIMEVAQMFAGGEFGGARPARMDWGAALIDKMPVILEKLEPIADKFATTSSNNRRVAELRSRGAAIPAARPVTATVESAAARTVAAPQTEPAEPAAAAAPERVAIQPPNMEWAKARAVQLFAAGKSGDTVAEWLDQLDEQLGAALASMDEEKFTAFVRADAILQQIASAPRFPRFVTDFVAYFNEQGEEEEKPTGAAAAGD